MIWFLFEGQMAMASWVLLALSPLIPVWSGRVVGLLIPGSLSAGYFVILFASRPGCGSSS